MSVKKLRTKKVQQSTLLEREITVLSNIRRQISKNQRANSIFVQYTSTEAIDRVMPFVESKRAYKVAASVLAKMLPVLDHMKRAENTYRAKHGFAGDTSFDIISDFILREVERMKRLSEFADMCETGPCDDEGGNVIALHTIDEEIQRCHIVSDMLWKSAEKDFDWQRIS